MYHLRAFNILGKTFFLTVFTIFIKKEKKIIILLLFQPEIHKTLSRGLGPAGPCNNHVLLQCVKMYANFNIRDVLVIKQKTADNAAKNLTLRNLIRKINLIVTNLEKRILSIEYQIWAATK